MSGSEEKLGLCFEAVDVEVLRKQGCKICGNGYHADTWTSCGTTTVPLCEKHCKAVRSGHMLIRCEGDALECTHVENPEQYPSTYPLQRGEPHPDEGN